MPSPASNPSPLSTAPPSRTSTPSSINHTGRTFTPTSTTAEDLLKEQTVGLVHLSDFRKRRAEAVERKEREARENNGSHGSALGRFAKAESDDHAAPNQQLKGDAPANPAHKKKRKVVAKGKLSFGLDEEEDTSSQSEVSSTSKRPSSPKKPRIGPNVALSTPAPTAMTKAALSALAAQKETLRREFLDRQNLVRATPIALPFVFHDGTDTPGGTILLKKGDQIWLFLDRARKAGAELGVGGDRGLREWARVSVDDLMMVRGGVIVPHHMTFHHFILHRTRTPDGEGILFDYSDQPPADANGDARDNKAGQSTEGADQEARLTKVVDRRWYERNKHIYPASTWEEWEEGKAGTKEGEEKRVRRDAGGNAYFF